MFLARFQPARYSRTHSMATSSLLEAKIVSGEGNNKGEKDHDEVDQVTNVVLDFNQEFLQKHFQKSPELDNKDFLVQLRQRFDR